MHICVIGAGTAGLCSAKNGLAAGNDVIIFEQTKYVGGTWVYTDEIGNDENGLPIHTSMYQGLRTNLPKEIMGFQDFQIPSQDLSYISSSDMLAFLNLYAEHFGLKEYIKFQHHVIHVKPYKDTQWKVSVKNLLTNTIDMQIFDAIFVCNGHYNTPKYPNYPGINLFKGKQLHSHDYRCANPFKDESVLIIGAGPSGVDLTYEIAKQAKKVILSHHSKKECLKTRFPDNVSQKPDVHCLLDDGVEFVDGTTEKFSVIFYCTGYHYKFPFLSDDCGISADGNYVRPLYKHCININKPTMAFIGLPFYVCASQMIDIQVRFCLKFLAGGKELPSKEIMLADTEEEMARRWAKGYTCRQAHMMGPDQASYFQSLADIAEIEPIWPVMTKLHNESSRRMGEDLIHFRNDAYEILNTEIFSCRKIK